MLTCLPSCSLSPCPLSPRHTRPAHLLLSFLTIIRRLLVLSVYCISTSISAPHSRISRVPATIYFVLCTALCALAQVTSGLSTLRNSVIQSFSHSVELL
jgi:hypothetical protein